AVDQATGSGQASQRWRFLPNSDGSYAMVAEHSGSCVTLPLDSGVDGSPVQQWHPIPWVTSGVGVAPLQNWLLIPTEPGYYKIHSTATGWVLQVAGASAVDGALVRQGSWTGGDNQQWSLSMDTDLDTNAWYTITARHSGLSLGVAGGPTATADGTPVEQALAANATNQRWRRQPVTGTDAYLLVPPPTSVLPLLLSCLDLNGGSTADGAVIQLWTQNGGANQNWQLVPVEPGCYKIQNMASGKVVQVTGGASAVTPGTTVQQWTWTGEDNQKW